MVSSNLFENDAVLYTSDLMPIKGKQAITSIFEFVFSRNDVEKVDYEVDSIFQIENKHCELGIITTTKIDSEPISQQFKAVFNNNSKIIELIVAGRK